MIHLLIVTALFSYLSASLVSLFGLSFKQTERSSAISLCLLMLGFSAHSVAIVPVLSSASTAGAEYYFWLAWGLAALILYFSRRFSSSLISAWGAATVTAFLASSSMLAHVGASRDISTAAENSVVALTPAMIALHILPALVSELALVIAALFSAALLVQERRLKKKTLDFNERTPSLSALDSTIQRFVLIGFVAMTCAVVSGAFWSFLTERPMISERTDPIQIIALLSWSSLALVLALRSSARISVRRSAFLVLCFGSLTMLSMILAVVWSGGWHGMR